MLRTRLSLGAALAALILWPGTARSQYNITTLLLDGAKIPQSTTGGTWNVNAGNLPTTPLSTDGAHLAFIQCGSPSGGCGPDSPDDGVWVESLSTKAFTHLVKPGDPVPASGGISGLTFTTFGTYALVAGGRVVFLAPDGPANGLYSVNITGTPVIKPIATQSMNLPGLGTGAVLSFGNITQFLPQSDGSLVVFFASASAGDAVYSADLNGSNLAELAGPNTPVGTPLDCGGPVYTYPEARAFNSNITILGGTNGGLFFIYVTPLTGMPLEPTCGTNGYIDYLPLVSYNTVLPDTGVFIDYATLTAIDGPNVYFNATGNGSTGVYQMPLSGNQQPAAIVGANQSLPGFGPPYASVGDGLGLAAENGTLIFSAGGFSGPGAAAGGVFAYNGGKIVRIAGTGDILNGAPGANWVPPVGPNSIAKDKVVFSFGNPNLIGVYLASPSPCAADVTAQVQITQTPPHLNPKTGDYNSKVTIKNTSAAAIPAPVSAVFDGLVDGPTNYGTQPPELLNKGAGGATTCLAPLGEAYLAVNGGKALAAGAETTVELNIANAAGTPSFTTRVVAGKGPR